MSPEDASDPLVESTPPAPDTVARWAFDYVLADTLGGKLSPPEPPSEWGDPGVVRLLAPGRPPELSVRGKAGKQRGFASAHGRARALHAFLHHELQAAELFAWALCAFPDAPLELRRGLVRILLDEVRHANLYAEQVRRLGFEVGAFPVRDWFWERVPSATSIESFLAVMGLGFEAGNLDHASRFEARFRDVGDVRAADVQRVVERDEIAHVRFGATWFRELTGSLDFDAWSRALPAPLSPMVMRGEPINREARSAAGLPEAFLGALAAWSPASGS